MTTINTNTSALITQLAMKRNERATTKAMEQLSTGKRINRAADDAAGAAVVVKMNGTIKGLEQVSRNANDAISMSETADGALGEITNILQRMRELAVQAANATAANRDLTDVEFQGLKTELNRMAQTTELNDIKLLDGSTPDGFVFQVGTRKGQTITIRLPDFTFNGKMSGVATLGTTTAENASAAITGIDQALDNVIASRADVGATISRLRTTVNNLDSIRLNSLAARSRILDADYAAASTEVARTQIIQQAATAILAQANATQQSVLKMLQ